ncbi:hypothetical protein N7470_010131 [Penicillium chermesinum]|nr:hypothetical protein N7470_010131 [Penicillium chermesinum]
MSTRPDRVSLARNHHPPSPFARARDSIYEFDLEASNFPTPSKQDGAHSRPGYRTSTLAGAYRAASRASMEEIIQLSPRRKQEAFAMRSSSSESNPPHGFNDLIRGARREDHQGSLAGRWWEYHEQYHGGLALSDATAHDDYGRASPRRRTSYTNDEERLRRVTGRDSPVFSKAKSGTRASLTAENLQRREYEQHRQTQDLPISQDDDGIGRSLNLPSGWGSRAKRNYDQWKRKSSQNSLSDSQEDVENSRTAGNAPIAATQAEDPSIPEPMRITAAQSGDAQEPQANGKVSRAGQSPIVDQVKTPEPPKLFESKIYDKTPRVTGAWIDTPLTERVADRVTELPDDLTKDDVVPAPAPVDPEPPTQEAQSVERNQPKVEEAHEKSTSNDSPKEQKKPATSKRPQPVVSRPKLPKSGLDTLIEDLRSGREAGLRVGR